MQTRSRALTAPPNWLRGSIRALPSDWSRGRYAALRGEIQRRGETLNLNVSPVPGGGWTQREDADAYLEYVEETGGRALSQLPSNQDFYVLRRDDGDRTSSWR